MYVRCLGKEDVNEVQRLIEEIYNDDMLAYNKYNILKNSYFAAVAVEDEKIIGCGGIWNNKYHDNAAYMSINVMKPYRKIGVGKAVLSVLESRRNRNKMQCAIKSVNESGINFAENNGFKLVRRTFEPLYDLKDNMFMNKNVFIPKGFQIFPLSKLKNYDSDILELFKEVYDRNHTFNKVAELSDETWNDIMYDSLNYDDSLVIIHENEVAAFSFIYNSDDKLKLEFGVRGVKQKYRFLENELILFMMLSQMKNAKENGYAYIADEIDDCDSGAMAASVLSDLKSQVSFNAYLKIYD